MVDARARATSVGALVERAPAKVNLTLEVLGRRADGYHDIESLVVFAGFGDSLTFAADGPLDLQVEGSFAASAGEVGDNLVLKAARLLAARIDGLTLGRFILSKRLPVAAGLGGGSADAAAALRLLARVNGIALDDGRLRDAARATGADVPVCLDPRPRVMRGIGDILSNPIDLPEIPVLLVNPGVRVPTKDVFSTLAAPAGRRPPTPIELPEHASRQDLYRALSTCGNDLEAAAISIAPAVAEVLRALRALPDVRLARMSGSGATCFALFDSEHAAQAATREIAGAQPDWWCRATTLCGV